MGFDVSWEDSTKTVYVSSKAETSQSSVGGNA